MVSINERGELYTKGINGNNEFKTSSLPKIWRISKDKVEGCKKCKLRYTCFDSVAIKEDNGVFFRNEKCELFPELFKNQ